MNLLEALLKKTEIIRENLAPLRDRLAQAQQDAPTEELRQTAARLSAQLSAAFEECVVATRESADIVNQELNEMSASVEAAQSTLAKLPMVRQEAERQRLELLAPPVKTRAPFVVDPGILERLRKELLIYVAIVKPEAEAKEPKEMLAFHDWVHESLLAGSRLPHAESSVVANSPDDTIADTSKDLTPRMAAQRPVSSFESWLHDSVRMSQIGSSMADRKEADWFKLFSASEAAPANGASER